MASTRWIDRIDVLEPSKRATGRWNFPESLETFESHFPRFRVVPGTFILEAVVEVATALAPESRRLSWRLGHAEEIRFRHYVQPGDVLEVSVVLLAQSEGIAAFRAQASVDGASVMTIKRLELVLAVTEPSPS